VTALKRSRRTRTKNPDNRNTEELAEDTEKRLQDEILSQNIKMVIRETNNPPEDSSPRLEINGRKKTNFVYLKKDEGLKRFWRRWGVR
jgi:hypothetical protein